MFSIEKRLLWRGSEGIQRYCIFWRIRLLFNPGKSSQKSGVVLYAGCRLIGRVYPKFYILTAKVGGRLIRPVVLYAGKYGI